PQLRHPAVFQYRRLRLAQYIAAGCVWLDWPQRHKWSRYQSHRLLADEGYSHPGNATASVSQRVFQCLQSGDAQRAQHLGIRRKLWPDHRRQLGPGNPVGVEAPLVEERFALFSRLLKKD